MIFNKSDILKFKNNKFIISKETLIERQNININEKEYKKTDNEIKILLTRK